MWAIISIIVIVNALLVDTLLLKVDTYFFDSGIVH
jgi:hypothetical protein